MRFLRGASLLLLVALTTSCYRAVRSEWSAWSGSSPDIPSVWIRFQQTQLPERGWLVEVPAAQAERLVVYSAPFDDASLDLRAYFAIAPHEDGAIGLLRTREGQSEFCVPNPYGDSLVHADGRVIYTHPYDYCAPLRAR